MELIQAATNYKPASFPESPYLKGKLEWDNRIGQTVISARNWRVAFFFATFLSVGLLAMNLIQITQMKVIPMVVAVNDESGEAAVLGKAGTQTYQPGEPQIRYFLTQFIRYVRTVPNDPVVVKANWMQAYKFLRVEAAKALNEITNSDVDSPLKKIGSETVTIQPISILFVPNSNSYQARWNESIYDQNGNVTDTYVMTALFTIEIDPPKTEEAVLINPLGIFIKSFQWDREIKESK